MNRLIPCGDCGGEHHWIVEHCPTTVAHIDNEKDRCSCGHSLYREHLIGGYCTYGCKDCELSRAYLAFRNLFQRGVTWK